MNYIYRSKKQTLPAVVAESKLAPYMPLPSSPPHTNLFTRKKSIDLIMEKHSKFILNKNDAIPLHNRTMRKTNYRPSKNRKAESSYIKLSPSKLENSDSKNGINRNKSTQIGFKYELGSMRKKIESEYSPYLLTQTKKSRSSVKFKPDL
jgi:hypothetical protein